MNSRKALAIIALLFAVQLSAPIAAKTIFTNANDLAATAKSTVSAQFTLAEPMLITSVRTQHTQEVPSGSIKLLRDGTPVFAGESTARAKTLLVVQPYLVLAPGTYTIETSSPRSWAGNKASGGQGIAVVNGSSLNTADKAAVMAYFTTAFNMTKPISLTDLDEFIKDLKLNIKDQANQITSGPGGRNKKDRDLFEETGMRARNGNGESGGHRTKKPMGGFQQSKIPTKYRDTFGGERKGGAGEDVDHRGYNRGDSGGNAMDGGDDDPASTIESMLRDSGGTPTGEPQADAGELCYAMSVGSDGYAATKAMSKSEREAHWTAERSRQLGGGGNVSYPNEGDTDEGTFRLFGNSAMRRAQLNFVRKAIEAKKGAAGAPNKESSGGKVKWRQGEDDRPEHEAGGGTINWEKVMEINTKVNPVRH